MDPFISKVNSYKWKDTAIYKTENDYGSLLGVNTYGKFAYENMKLCVKTAISRRYFLITSTLKRFTKLVKYYYLMILNG